MRVKLPRNYQEQTHASPYWIVRWPHQQRVKTAVDLILTEPPNRILDYGAGDGIVIAEAITRGLVSTAAVAYEPVPTYAAQFADRLPDVELITERAALVGPIRLRGLSERPGAHAAR